MQRNETTLTDQNEACESVDAEATFNDTLKVLGDFWVLRIISVLEANPQRFCELERSLKNSNPVTLTKKLKKLEESGFVARKSESVDKQSVNYLLTDKGRAVLPVVTEIKRFSAAHR